MLLRKSVTAGPIQSLLWEQNSEDIHFSDFDTDTDCRHWSWNLEYAGLFSWFLKDIALHKETATYLCVKTAGPCSINYLHTHLC